MRVGVMRGDLRDFDLAQVLQVVGIGRQYMCVEVHGDSSVLGRIFVKSGQVVRVDSPDATGRDALFKLFGRSDGQFHVFRLETPEVLPEPIGALPGLLLEALNDNGRDTFNAPTRPTASPHPTINGHASMGAFAAEHAQASEPSLETPPSKVCAAPAEHSSSRASPHAPIAAYGRRGKILAVASPKGGCGKTTVALNVALSLARQGRSVVLVDADINGDVLSAIDARQRADTGALEVLLGIAEAEQALLDTVLPRFKIMPAVGHELPSSGNPSIDLSSAWEMLLRELSGRAELVIVDTPAGMFGVTQQVLRACSHVLGVLQAEVVANRSFSRFHDGLAAVPDEVRPQVVGIVINMLQTTHSASLSVFQAACTDLPAAWLFDTSIPRHNVFLDSAEAGVPLRHLDEVAPPAVAWLFDNLAAEVVERLKLDAAQRKPQPLLL